MNKTSIHILITLAFVSYIAILLFTPYSLSGFWEESYLILTFAAVNVVVTFQLKLKNDRLRTATFMTNLLLGMFYFFYFSITIFSQRMGVTDVLWVEANGRYYNLLYFPFKENERTDEFGTLYIYETSLKYPLIEKRIGGYSIKHLHSDPFPSKWSILKESKSFLEGLD